VRVTQEAGMGCGSAMSRSCASSVCWGAVRAGVHFGGSVPCVQALSLEGARAACRYAEAEGRGRGEKQRKRMHGKGGLTITMTAVVVIVGEAGFRAR
jgi:hypothetical protein